jgi:hypothetical protein
MRLIPAIDLSQGQVVRLKRGDMAAKTVYGDDPVAVAQSFREAGAELIHVVDLDGAFDGRPCNDEAIRAICASAGVRRSEEGYGPSTPSAPSSTWALVAACWEPPRSRIPSCCPPLLRRSGPR